MGMKDRRYGRGKIADIYINTYLDTRYLLNSPLPGKAIN